MNSIATSVNQKKLIVYIFCAFAFLLCFKAFVVVLTYDEAYSFLYYVLPGDFFSTTLANNHPLNSLLMFVTTSFGESEFMLRLPNVLFGLAYLGIAAYWARRSAFPLLTFLILNACPYVFEFFTLARGYGIATSLIFAGMMCHLCYGQTRWAVVISALFFVLAGYAFYPTIILPYVFVFCVGVVEWKSTTWRNKWPCLAAAVMVVLGSIYPVWAMWRVSLAGKALYGDRASSVWDVLKSGFGFTALFNPDGSIVGFLVVALILLGVLFGIFAWTKQRVLVLSLVGFVLAYFGMALIAGRPLPTHRLLVPCVPLLLLVSSVACNYFLEGMKPYRQWVIGGVCCVLLIVNFAMSLRLKDTFDWREGKVDPVTVTEFHFENGRCVYNLLTRNPAQSYYVRKKGMQGGLICNASTGQVITLRRAAN